MLTGRGALAGLCTRSSRGARRTAGDGRPLEQRHPRPPRRAATVLPLAADGAALRARDRGRRSRQPHRSGQWSRSRRRRLPLDRRAADPLPRPRTRSTASVTGNHARRRRMLSASATLGLGGFSSGAHRPERRACAPHGRSALDVLVVLAAPPEVPWDNALQSAARHGRAQPRPGDQPPPGSLPRLPPAATASRASSAAGVPASPDFSGWNWVAHSGPCSTAATNLSPPYSRPRDLGAARAPAARRQHPVAQAVRVHEVEALVTRVRRTSASRRRRLDGVPAHVRHDRRLQALDDAGPLAASLGAHAVLDALGEQDLHADADAQHRTSGDQATLDDAHAVDRHGDPACTPRTHRRPARADRRPRPHRARRSVSVDLGTSALDGAHGRAEVARAVVEHRDAGTRSRHRAPLVLGMPVSRGSIAMA